MDPLAFSVQETLQLLGIGRSKLYAEIADGRITTCKVGSRTLITAADLHDYIERLRSEATTRQPRKSSDG